ncbi:guanine deaminase [Durotheca rogersii]|uniref:guanine deaminase n=1 Tax=Durotheca rogersii TaxID=419775 RepID=UPI00221FDAD8|nr:guanine deaminase [Durotheca rogersii]KAI5865639.1 guanine deaminase [Durotheca rogersii]
MDRRAIFHGAVIHSLGPSELVILERALLVVDSGGTIAHFAEDVAREAVPSVLASLDPSPAPAPAADADADGRPRVEVRYLGRGEFVMPGLVDAHNHAPQWGQRGLGQGLHILDWLAEVTFPNEARFADAAHARRVYAACVGGMLRQGVTTAAYYGSRHAEATGALADLCHARGQRALVGKCNMDRGAPARFCDADAAASLRDTEACIAHVRRLDPAGALLRYVLTPRFAVACGPALLAGLGALAGADPRLAVQTHFSEAEQEVRRTRELFPAFAGSEADLYASFGLLGPRTILAHCCLVDDREIDRVRALGCGVAHCPVANATVGGGFMAAPVRRLLRRGVHKIGLGTDSGGGFSSSVLDAARMALVASAAREAATAGADPALTLAEVFYLATLGGARVCGVGDRVGCFAAGREFDALVIDANESAGVMAMLQDDDDTRIIFEKFLMTGDDRNIREVYVCGRSVKPQS